MDREKEKWFQVALRLRGSVISAVLPRVILCGTFGFFVALLHKFGVSVSMPFLSALIPNIVLGLLLVFRTNTAYERFWEGRKAWGSIVNSVRNLSRQIWVSIDEKEPKDRENKISALRLLIAFAIATKLHLRSEPVNSELEPFMSQSRYFKLKTMNNPPLEVAFWIGDYLQEQYTHKHLNAHQLTALQSLINILVDNLGACERILRTPIPIAYAIHLKQLLLLYCLALPFQMVKDLTWWTGPIVALISFTLFGIEEIGIEIENPFGHDANDLPLDAICATMKRNIEDLISLAPSVRDWNKTGIEQME
ncbi:hypothetical protein NDI37_23235 [Funiculus sociatus GB2-A5]|uniref:Uncharacterized protein n=1 Tax=Funiculus sociatus GB2-A5 TaxID=2933946 RepID=A0ABV0JVG4_9CYAN|nr:MULTISPECIES: bestrophin family ion channel [unclassified Trichocoleus]MBD1904575.1 hypothetical protein [Trichocoleus sp. FACHB-832]MBD2060947.1 hypothetical protein [Trichocoleus sp. FACHB-6]